MRFRALLLPALVLALAACGAQSNVQAVASTPTMTPRPTFTATAEPTATPAATNTPQPTPTPAATDTPEPTPTPRIHVVQSGETLSGIAEAYSVTLDALIQANGITNPSLVVVGQELIIPSP